MKKQLRWYNNGIKEIQISLNECIPEGFFKGRLAKPKKIDALSKQFSKEKLYEDYIINNKSFMNGFNNFNNIQNNLKYNNDSELLNQYDPMNYKNNTIPFFTSMYYPQQFLFFHFFSRFFHFLHFHYFQNY